MTNYDICPYTIDGLRNAPNKMDYRNQWERWLKRARAIDRRNEVTKVNRIHRHLVSLGKRVKTTTRLCVICISNDITLQLNLKLFKSGDWKVIIYLQGHFVVKDKDHIPYHRELTGRYKLK